jgi:hypothetical protein
MLACGLLCPKNSMQQRIQGAAVRVGDEGWLDECERSRAFFCLLVENKLGANVLRTILENLR